MVLNYTVTNRKYCLLANKYYVSFNNTFNNKRSGNKGR